MHRLLYVDPRCYFDDADGASVAGRALMAALAGHGFAVEVLSGPPAIAEGVGLAAWLSERGGDFEPHVGKTWSLDAHGVRAGAPAHLCLSDRGVTISLLCAAAEPVEHPDGPFLDLFEAALDRIRPEVLAARAGGRVVDDLMTRGKARGVATVLLLQDCRDAHAALTAGVDEVVVPSQFAADYCRGVRGGSCTVLPNVVDRECVFAGPRDPRYVTFVDPSIERGVYAFARIADELGRRRPDIPLLVVEGEGTEATLASCGLDLRAHDNVFFAARSPDPRTFWGVSRLCLMPSLRWEGHPVVAVEAMANGVPVIGSDRGALPEVVDTSGVTLPLPECLTPATTTLPTAEDVSPWVEAVIRLWDDAALAAERSRLALDRARPWSQDVLGPRYVRFFDESGSGSKPPPATPAGRARPVVLIPHINGIEWECEKGLRHLESAGVHVVRREGCSAIDVARNILASDALHDGYETLLFIDSDIGFDPLDALRLLNRPEPVVAGVYAKKGLREMASRFADGIEEVVFGAEAPGPYPLKYAAAGFLRVRAEVLRRMTEELELPICNAKWERGFWPFFQPLIVPEPEGRFHYLGEDFAFSHRLGRIGVTPLADTSIRLWHNGRYRYSWEDAGTDPTRFRSYRYRIEEGHPVTTPPKPNGG